MHLQLFCSMLLIFKISTYLHFLSSTQISAPTPASCLTTVPVINQSAKHPTSRPDRTGPNPSRPKRKCRLTLYSILLYSTLLYSLCILHSAFCVLHTYRTSRTNLTYLTDYLLRYALRGSAWQCWMVHA